MDECIFMSCSPHWLTTYVSIINIGIYISKTNMQYDNIYKFTIFYPLLFYEHFCLQNLILALAA